MLTSEQYFHLHTFLLKVFIWAFLPVNDRDGSKFFCERKSIGPDLRRDNFPFHFGLDLWGDEYMVDIVDLCTVLYVFFDMFLKIKDICVSMDSWMNIHVGGDGWKFC